jgi:hypothetical protein
MDIHRTTSVECSRAYQCTTRKSVGKKERDYSIIIAIWPVSKTYHADKVFMMKKRNPKKRGDVRKGWRKIKLGPCVGDTGRASCYGVCDACSYVYCCACAVQI